MAIDTATKRASALLEPGQLVYPPDGAISSAADRGIPLEFYLGIVPSAPAEVEVVNPWLQVMSDRNWLWNRLPESAWELVMSDRNWRAME